MVECVIFGGLLLDRYFELKSLPERGQDGFIKKEFDCVGGCAINMAATFNNLGGNAHVVSYIGKDEVGEKILSYMKEHGFSMRYVEQKEGTTGYCLVFLEEDGERTFLTKTGMELEFSKELLKDRLKGIKYAAVTGYFLLNDGAEKIIEVLEDFEKDGGYILFDPSPLVSSIDKQLLRRIVNISSMITPNESEIAALANLGAVPGVSEQDSEKSESDLAIRSDASESPLRVLQENNREGLSDDIYKWIKSFAKGRKAAVLKKGGKGGTVYGEKGSFSYGIAGKTEVVDTTGAGDSFAAGLLYGIAGGAGLRSSVELGQQSALITIGINGPHGFWRPDEALNKIFERTSDANDGFMEIRGILEKNELNVFEKNERNVLEKNERNVFEKYEQEEIKEGRE